MAQAAPAQGPPDREGRMAKVRANTWASLGVTLAMWLGYFLLLALILALATDDPSIAFVGGVLGGLAAAVGTAYKMDLIGSVDQARRGAPLWVRLLLPLPLLAFLLLVLTILLGPLIEAFVLLLLAISLLAVVGTGAVVYFIGLWDDVPQRVRETRPTGRLLATLLVAVVSGLLGFLIGLMVLEEAYPALAIFLPALIAGGILFAVLMHWTGAARDGLRDLPIWGRLLGFAVLFLFVTYYFALLAGPALDSATLVYAASAVAALALLIPLSMYAHTWRDLWARFVSLGESNRVLAVLPVFPLAAALIFLLIVVLSSNFEVAYVVSIPAGIAAFLLVGLAFRVTQEIPGVVRGRSLPRRVGIFAVAFLLFTAYAYFAVALFTQAVEVSLIAGMLFAAIVLAVCIKLFDLGAGLGEEFESYGARGEALVLGLVFVGTLLLTFILLALATGSFRIAFLVSVIAAAATNYLIAHTTKLVVGLRDALAEIPWWAELLVLTTIFLGAFLYGTIAVGQFLGSVPIALAAGAVVGLASVVLIAWDLKIGEDVLETADERKRARSVLLLLAFLGGFLVGLYVAAGAMSAAGSDLFGVPFFVALASGLLVAFWLARSRGWLQEMLARVATTRDRAKVSAIFALWLALGILTGFLLQGLPIAGTTVGLSGDELPLALTLAVGIALWLPLPAVLFRAVGVERTPVRATMAMGEKPRFLASLGWGALAGLIVLVVLTTIVDVPLVSFGTAIVAGYIVALVVTMVRGRRASVRDPRRRGAGDAPPARPPQ